MSEGASGRVVAASLLAIGGAILLAPAASAQDAGGLQPICADRPTKADGPCTVDVGHFQIEADLVNASFMSADGATTDTWLLFNPTIKFGLAPKLDLEVNIDPIEIVRNRDAEAKTSTASGISDTYFRVKYEFLNATAVQAALLPYVKAPTARAALGNGAWEGGLIVPVNIKLSSMLSLALQPEFDDLDNADGRGHHLAVSQDVSLGFSVPRNVTLFAEAWAQWSFDPAGEQKQYSLDIAAALGLGRDSQLDAGVNFGLNKATPGIAPYIGVSHRF